MATEEIPPEMSGHGGGAEQQNDGMAEPPCPSQQSLPPDSNVQPVETNPKPTRRVSFDSSLKASPLPSEDAQGVLSQTLANSSSFDVGKEVGCIALIVRQQLEEAIRTTMQEQMQESVDLIRGASSQLTSLVRRLQKLGNQEVSFCLGESGEGPLSPTKWSTSELSLQGDDALERRRPHAKSSDERYETVACTAEARDSPSRGQIKNSACPHFDQVAPVLPGSKASSSHQKPNGRVRDAQQRVFSTQRSGVSVEPTLKADRQSSSGRKKERMSFKSLEDKLNKDLFVMSVSPDAFKAAAPVNSVKVSPLWNGPESRDHADRQSKSPKARQPVAKEQQHAQLVEADVRLNIAVESNHDYKQASDGDLPMFPKTLEQEEEKENDESQSEKSESELERSENEQGQSSTPCKSPSRDVRKSKSKLRLNDLRQRRTQELTVAIAEKRQSFSPIVVVEEDPPQCEEIPDDGCLKRRLCDAVESIGSNIAQFLSCIAGVQDVSHFSACSLLFRICILLFGVGSFVASIVNWRTQSNLPDDQRMGLPGLLVDLALGAGAVFGLLACRFLGANRYSMSCYEMLLAFAEQKDFVEELTPRQSWDACAAMVWWCLAVAERLREVLLSTPLELQLDLQVLVPVVSFAISSSLLIAFLFSFLRICLSLHVMIDDFSSHVASTADFCGAAHEWNVLQALLRSSCARAQYLFLVLQTTIVASVTLGVFDFYNHPGRQTIFIAPAILLTGVAQLFLRAATVTDHCERLPSFVNSLSFGEACSQDRMYLVEYIQHSKAGFYVFEVRLTSGIVLKAFYVLCMGLFALITKIMTEL
eukprot:TRINITY_DN73032_c0_g1_i1.p1 TRINITY_DN73032_c0_g1~~TRINITY_DN73032_c0_g1_i1.p1  ORF type:complete len:828 (+),score=130.63 TRINITY_DN73032_c0_g1_i1:35-2485(+)